MNENFMIGMWWTLYRTWLVGKLSPFII